jgi:hypothetical protein
MPRITLPTFNLTSIASTLTGLLSGGHSLSLPALTLPTLPSFTLPTLPSFTLPTLPSFTLPTLPSFTLPTLPGLGGTTPPAVTPPAVTPPADTPPAVTPPPATNTPPADTAPTGPLTLTATNANNHIIGSQFDDSLTAHRGTDTLEGGAGNDHYYYHIGDGRTTIIDSAGSNDVLTIDGITNVLSIVGQLHVTEQEGGFILTLGNDVIDAKGIDIIHIDALQSLAGTADITAEQLIALGAQLG